MRATNETAIIRLRVLTPQRTPLGGTVNIELRDRKGAPTLMIKGADASKDIDVPVRIPGLYELIVTPADNFVPVTRAVNVPLRGVITLEVVVASATPQPPSDAKYRVYGIVRDALQRPLQGACVKAADKDIRGEQPLGATVVTDACGAYQIAYSQGDFAETDLLAADIIVRVFSKDGQLLKESAPYYNAPEVLRVDLTLSDAVYAGPSEFEQIVATVTPVTGKLALSDLAQNDETQDVTFLTQKTGLPQERIEALAMAFGFEKQSQVPASAFYGLLRHAPATGSLTVPLGVSPATSFDSRAALLFAALMRQDIDSLMSAVQAAIDANVIPFSLGGDLASLRKLLLAAQLAYFKGNPQPASPATLTLKLSIAGLQGEQVAAFKNLLSAAGAPSSEFWATLAKDPAFQSQKAALLQSVFTLSQLTGEQVVLTDQLINLQQIQNPGDLQRLAANTSQDWLTTLQQQKIAPPAGIPGDTPAAQLQAYAAQLEQNFITAFPTPAFAARIRGDARSGIPGAASLSQFLDNNPTFDLLTTRIGGYLSKQRGRIAAPADLTAQLKKTQRVFKLSPTYAAANTLLADNVDSAHKIYRMGQKNFVNRYGSKLGATEAARAYQKAAQTHALAVALTGNLKSLSDASHLAVFPDYTPKILEAMKQEVPDLDTLFGHTDFCQCDECRSVYGPAAYLTDILHYLENRVSSIACAPGENASAAEVLFRRRADLADIDLNCDNAMVAFPYIDIANEIMEDYIAAPVVTINSSFLPKLVAGPIDAGMLGAITTAFQTSGQTNIASALTAGAQVAAKYSMERLLDDDTCVTLDHWIIRDQFVVLKATDQGAAIGVQLLHETLLSQDEINANPEYVNIGTYNNVLKSDKRPFTLPFDLFETEGELYLSKLGTAKPDLIDIFRAEHQPAVAPSAATQSDLDRAFAYLKVNQAERTLIFQADAPNQNLYWGALSAGASVELDLFMQATGLDYDEVLELLALQTINPLKDSVIVNDDLSCDTDKKHVNNLTAAKFDLIHRFVRLWNKTSLSLEELDAIVQATALGNGAIAADLAWKLQQFMQLRQLLQQQQGFALTTLQYLAFFQDLDTKGNNSLYDSLFQNREVTNPLNPDFAVAVVTRVVPAPPAITSIHKGLLIGALGLPPADLDTLIANTDGLLSLHNITYFYRMSQLSQALSVDLADLLTLIDLINIAPFLDPPTTAAFYAKWRTLVASGFSADELNYVLRHRNDSGDSQITSDDLVATALADLQSKLLQAQAATAVAPDPAGQLLKKWLTDPLLDWNPALVTKLLDILATQDDADFQTKVDNSLTFLVNLRVQYHDSVLTADLPALPVGLVFPDTLAAQISYDAPNRQLQLTGYLSAADRNALNLLSLDGPYLAAVGQLFQAAQQTSSAPANTLFATAAAVNANLKVLTAPQIPARYQLILAAIAPAYLTLRQQKTVQDEICGWFKINQDVAAAIETSQPGIYADLTAAAFVGKSLPLTTANYPNQFNWYQKIAKLCFITGKLKLSAADLTWLMARGPVVGSLDLWSLPIVPVAGPVTSFAAFEVLVNILKFSQAFPPVSSVTAAVTRDISVYTILEDGIGAAPIAALESDLTSLTGWDSNQLDQLINAPSNYLNIVLAPSDLKDIRVLLRLGRCFATMTSLGATAAKCIAWMKPSLTYDDATQIKQALRARYPQDQWLGATQPLQNQLRHAKRDALVAHLLANPPAGANWVNSDSLYDHFLIDVEMMSAQPTSRIVEATNSVQQFVQRCHLNLEAGITVDLDADPDWQQWQWMKYFRLWQANRKVFLYPENWIEPDLLPAEIKSPFFADLQSDLLQNDVTQDNVEAAFLTYLEKLEGVSRLEVKAMWYDDSKQTLHVVSRTFGGDPKTYYYRQFVQNRRWTPWIKIDQDIASDHIVLTVFNHRIYLFWAVFSEKSAEVTEATVPAAPGSAAAKQPIDPPPKYLQIQLAFTEYREGKWTPKKLSSGDSSGSLSMTETWSDTQPDPITGASGAYTPARADFVFTPLDLPDLGFVQKLLSGGKVKDPATFLKALQLGLQGALAGNGDLQINCYLQNGANSYSYRGSFDLDPCKGYPVVVSNRDNLVTTLFDRSLLVNMLDTEQDDSTPNTLAVRSVPFLLATPGRFANVVSLQMGFIDRLINVIYRLFLGLGTNGFQAVEYERRLPVSVGTFMPYFYQDGVRTYFAQPEISDGGDFEFIYQDMEDLLFAVLLGDTNKVHEILATFPRGKALYLLVHFYNFYHPLVCSFMRILYDRGIDALMSRPTQLQNDVIFDTNPDKFDFGSIYQPSVLIYSGTPVTYTGPAGPVVDAHPGYPKGDVDFNPKGGYSQYNWELFFHAPLLIAQRLDQNLQFEDAERWFRYIFNPTDGSSYPSPDKFWVTKPFFVNVNDKYVQQDINNIMLGIDSGNSALVQDVTDWRNNPFQPHYIAQYRTVAYQKTTVMKYLDHLIAWADSLYVQGTMETVLEAEQLYVLADEILGPKPLIIAPAFETPVDNFGELAQKLDAFSNAMVDIENILPLQEITGFGDAGQQNLPALETLYFCIPPNDQLLSYWDKVAGRLFNIRHSLTIDGKFAPPALFAPVIDPGLLVRAAAAGLDIGSILADMNSPLPNYRFTVMVQKSIDLCGEVKALGTALLQAMEKKDAEDMALLRSKNGIAVFKAMLLVKQQQVDEATHNLEGLQQQQALVQSRISYYQGLISTGLNSWETISLGLTQAGIAGDLAAVEIEYLGNILGLIPDFDLGAEGFGGSPVVTVKFGGTQLGGATRAIASAIRGIAGVAHSQAGVASTQATYARRLQEWQYQLTLANTELQQVLKQILAATVRLSIANQEVTNQQLQIDNAELEDDFMHDKFTNSDLYSYMIGQLSTTYFQSYQLAYALAKQTEQTFRYELGLADSSYINFGYWNSLRKGLLAGEQLAYDLRNMEKAYRDQNVREYELTKHICLSQLDASALQQLKTNLECWINLPEELFDMDYPGHYLRRVKTVSLTIPCVAGPYTTVSCTLTMTRNSVRTNNLSGVAYPRKVVSGVAADDSRFRDSVGSIQSIATSSAQNDDGLFELSFRDDRYLPFEGAGAISQWHLQFPSGVTPFDYSTVSDVIMHLKYTARDGGEALRSDAATSLKTRINSMLVSLKDVGLTRIFSVRHEFPTAWYAFLNTPAGSDQVLALDMTRDRFPYFASVAPTLKIKSLELVADSSLAAINAIQVAPKPSAPAALTLTKDAYYGSMLRLKMDYAAKPNAGTWTITNPKANLPLTADQVSDLCLIAYYEVSMV